MKAAIASRMTGSNGGSCTSDRRSAGHFTSRSISISGRYSPIAGDFNGDGCDEYGPTETRLRPQPSQMESSTWPGPTQNTSWRPFPSKSPTSGI